MCNCHNEPRPTFGVGQVEFGEVVDVLNLPSFFPGEVGLGVTSVDATDDPFCDLMHGAWDAVGLRQGLGPSG